MKYQRKGETVDAFVGAIMGIGIYGVGVAVIVAVLYGWALSEAKKEARGKADAERAKESGGRHE